MCVPGIGNGVVNIGVPTSCPVGCMPSGAPGTEVCFLPDGGPVHNRGVIDECVTI